MEIIALKAEELLFRTINNDSSFSVRLSSGLVAQSICCRSIAGDKREIALFGEPKSNFLKLRTS